MDSQNNAWNEWANYLLYIVKKHEGDIEKIKEELKNSGLNLESLDKVKLNEDDFQKFLTEDYVIFKTEVKTAEKKRNRLWGIVLGVVTILNILLRFVVKF